MNGSFFPGSAGRRRGPIARAAGAAGGPQAVDSASPVLPASALLVALLLGVGACSPGAGPASQTTDANPVQPAGTASSIAWPGMAPATAKPAAPASTDRVPPVASMVDGLRARLEQSPDDPKGWALLAQSYAFMGDREGAEAALARAVALGMNEPELRQRIEAAAPASPPPTDWVQQALNR